MQNFIKIFLTVISISSSTLLAQDYGLQEFRSDLNRVRQSYQSTSRSKETMALLKALVGKYDLSRWIGEIPSVDWASPSPERLARINEIADAISPYDHMLVDLAFDGKTTNDSSYAVNLLWYTESSGDLKHDLQEIADRKPMAYQMLFELGLFDQDVRLQYCKGFSTDSDVRKQRAIMASDWGLVEALPIYEEMLNEPFDPSTISFVGGIGAESSKSTLHDYKTAASGIMHLGSKAAELLPLLKKRMLEIRQAFPSQYRTLTGDLQAAMDVLEGRRPQSWETAMNGRGAINLTDGPEPKWGAGK